jgi:hypothetical protein
VNGIENFSILFDPPDSNVLLLSKNGIKDGAFLGLIVVIAYDTKVKPIIPNILLPIRELKKLPVFDISKNFISLTPNITIKGINSKTNCLIKPLCITSKKLVVSIL